MLYNQSETMNIVVASDQNYLPHLVTLVTSVGEHHTREEIIVIHIFDGGISTEGRKKIEYLNNLYSNLIFEFYDFSEVKLGERLGFVSADRSLSAYARIFIPEVLSADRAIYLDVDGIVIENLRDLYNTDLSNIAIAGVLDTNPIQRHYSVGLKTGEPYINSGMVLWNLKKCRETAFTRSCLSFIKERDGQIDAMDQGTINGVLSPQGLIRLLPPKYNVLTTHFQMTKNEILAYYQLPDYYSDEEIISARKQPVFVHFTPNMTTRPWEENCQHPLREEYWTYRLKGFGGKKELSQDKRSLKKRCLSWVYHNLPKQFYLMLLKWRNG